MKLYWEARRAGQRLILLGDDETETEVGAVRSTPRGFDALAKTNTYDPGRAQKGFETIEEAKAFVETFHPWDIFGGDLDLEVEPDVRRLPAETHAPSASESVQATEPAAASTPAEDEPGETAGSSEPSTPIATESAESDVEEEQPRKRGWQFWKEG